MSGIPPNLFMNGEHKIIHQYDATSGGYWTSQTEFLYTVPTGKRAMLLGFSHDRDAAQTSLTEITDGTNRLLYLESHVAGGDQVVWPSPSDQDLSPAWFPIILHAGYEVKMTFGGNQGAAAYATIWVLEWYV